jgi:hypothetical protein
LLTDLQLKLRSGSVMYGQWADGDEGVDVLEEKMGDEEAQMWLGSESMPSQTKEIWNDGLVLAAEKSADWVTFEWDLIEPTNAMDNAKSMRLKDGRRWVEEIHDTWWVRGMGAETLPGCCDRATEMQEREALCRQTPKSEKVNEAEKHWILWLHDVYVCDAFDDDDE